MGIFSETASKARDFIFETGKAAGEAISTGKLKYELTSLKSDIRKNYALLGKLTYRAMRDKAEIDPKAEQIAADITEQFKKVRELEAEIAEKNDKKVCDCGRVCDEDATFCAKCGKEL